MSINSGLQRAWFQMALVLSAIAALLWIKYRGSQTLRDVASYLLFASAVSVVSFYCLRSISAHRRHRLAPGECVVLARAKSPAWFYWGAIWVGIGFIMNAIILLNLMSDSTQFAQRLDSALNGGSEMHLWLGVSLCSFALGLLFAWLGAYQVRITAPLFENWSLFGGYRSIHFGEIKDARIRSSWIRNWSPIRLEILPTQGSNNKMPIIVNLKVFRQVDIDSILRWLEPKLESRTQGR